MSQVVSACVYLGQSPLGPQIVFSCLPSWPHIQSSPAQRHLLEGLGAGQEPSLWAVHPELWGFKPTVAPRGPGGNTRQSLVLAEA